MAMKLGNISLFLIFFNHDDIGPHRTLAKLKRIRVNFLVFKYRFELGLKFDELDEICSESDENDEFQI